MNLTGILRTAALGTLAMLVTGYVVFIQTVPDMSDVEPPMGAAELQEFRQDEQIIADENYPLMTEFPKPWDFEN